MKPKPPADHDEYKDALRRMVMANHAAAYKACRDCGWPTHGSYCCSTCGSSNP
jgi:hypothetical protein